MSLTMCYLFVQVQGVYGRPGVSAALLPACGGSCSDRLQRRGPDFSQKVHLCPRKGKMNRESIAYTHTHNVDTHNVQSK